MSLPVRRIRLSGHRFSSHPPKHHPLGLWSPTQNWTRLLMRPTQESFRAPCTVKPWNRPWNARSAGVHSDESATNFATNAPTGCIRWPDTLPTPVEPSRPNISDPIPIHADTEFSADWEALPTPIPPPPKDNYTSTGPTPTGYEELPTWNTEVKSSESKFDVEATVNRLTAYLWQNTFVAFAVILGMLLSFLALAGILMNSCSG